MLVQFGKSCLVGIVKYCIIVIALLLKQYETKSSTVLKGVNVTLDFFVDVVFELDYVLQTEKKRVYIRRSLLAFC